MKQVLHIDGDIFARQPHGGISRVFTELLAAWARRDEVTVHLHLPADLSSERTVPPSDVVERIPARRSGRGARLLGPVYQARWRDAVRRHWAQAKTGVFLSTYYTSPPGVARPRLLVVHDMIYERYADLFPAPKHEQHRRDKARCVREAQGILCPSAHALRDTAEIYALDGIPTWVVPYAPSPPFFGPPDPAALRALRQQLTGGGEYLLFTGGRGRHKNFTGLLHAFAALEGHDEVHLLAAGGGAPTTEEQALLHHLGVGARVHFTGSLPDADIVSLMQGARAVVVPSFSEGFGFPLVEAMAAGRPVLSARAGSLPDVGGDVPLYFDPHDPAAMAAALRQGLSLAPDDPRLRAGVARAAARTWDDVAEEFLQCAATLCSSSPRTPPGVRDRPVGKERP